MLPDEPDSYLALDGEDLRRLPLSMRKQNLARLRRGRPDRIFVAPFEQGEIGPDLFRAACNRGSKAWCRSGPIVPIAPADRRTVKVKNRKHPATSCVME